jgi:hypothetical protein
MGSIDRYRSRLSGPLLDRIDLQVLVGPVSIHKLRSGAAGESSATIRERVLAARDRQRARFAQHGIRCNAEMTSRILRDTCPLDAKCERALVHIVEERKWMSARSVSRIIKVARTIADVLDLDRIDAADLVEAAGYRAVDPLADVALAAMPREDHREPRLAQQRARGTAPSKFRSAETASAVNAAHVVMATEATDVGTGEAAYTALGLGPETAAIISAAGFAAERTAIVGRDVVARADIEMTSGPTAATHDIRNDDAAARRDVTAGDAPKAPNAASLA